MFCRFCVFVFCVFLCVLVFFIVRILRCTAVIGEFFLDIVDECEAAGYTKALLIFSLVFSCFWRFCFVFIFLFAQAELISCIRRQHQGAMLQFSVLVFLAFLFFLCFFCVFFCPSGARISVCTLTARPPSPPCALCLLSQALSDHYAQALRMRAPSAVSLQRTPSPVFCYPRERFHGFLVWYDKAG